MASGTELGKAYVQIVPSAQGISGKISGLLGPEISSAGDSAGKSIGGSLISALKSALVAAGIGTIVKEALSAGGDLQQSFGGLDTIYGDAAKAAKNYAAEAAKAGISANDYAEQAVSFGASLKQAFEGDTVKAVEAANTAIMDMADNSAKMGTDIGMVQSAYQGFAKQNYTMLDNLKLGYGGTKTEMERLLADAQKLSGVEYNIDNLGDVYDAIHVIQKDLGLTGVAAQEASETFTGSFNAMKAAGENLLANISLGNDITPYLSDLLASTGAFLTNNLFPMLGNIFQGLPTFITEGLIPALNETISMAIEGLNFAADNAGAMVSTALDLVTTLGTAIISAAPVLMEAAIQCSMAFADAIINYDWASFGAQFMTAIQGLFPADMGTSVIQPIYDGITAALPGLLSTGVEIITNIANGILNAIPGLITTAGELVVQFADFVLNNAPAILSAGVELLLNLVHGIIQALPQIVDSAQKVAMQLITTILQHLPELLQTGSQLMGELVSGLIQMLPEVVSAALQMVSNYKDTIMSVDWIGLGVDIINGIISGLQSMGESFIQAILSLCQNALGAVKKFFGIESPSKVMANEVGRYIPEGIALGIEQNAGAVTDAMDDLKNDALEAAASDFTMSTSFNNSNSAVLARMDMMIGLMSKYFPELENTAPQGVYGIDYINRQLGNALI